MSKILLAEDNEDLLMVLKVRLEAAGFDVETATNGEEALQKVALMQPDLVCMDIFMPVMDGIKVLQVLRNAEHVNNVPVLLLSGSTQAMDNIKKSTLAQQVYGYLLKPFEFSSLVATIHEALEPQHS